MLEKYLPRTEFSSYEDFIDNYVLDIPRDFNFGFDVVDEWAITEPDKIALVWRNDCGEEKSFTFHDIKALSNKAANFFVSLGIKKGDFIMLILKQRYEYWICATALHKIGAIVIPATIQLTKKDIIYRNNAAGVKAIIAFDEGDLIGSIKAALPESPTVKNVIVVAGATQGGGATSSGGVRSGFYTFSDEIEKYSDVFERPTGAEANTTSDFFLLYFTSGTTGMPKMVMHDYSYPFGHITTAKYWQRVVNNGLHLTVSDSGWAKFGWGKIYGQWFAGTAVFAYDMDRFVPKNMLSVMQKYPITTFCAPPTMYRFMIQENVSDYDLSSIVHYTTAGEPLNPEVFNQWKEFTGKGIIEGFGQSESSVLLANFEWFEPKPGSTGRPSPLYDIVIMDADNNECDVGIEGRIVVKGLDEYAPPGLFKFYYNDEQLTKKVWSDGIYSTGDVAWVDSDGHYWFVGRDDDIIKCSGYRIGPFEVESALLEHKAVVECAVTAAPDPIRGQVVKASIVLARGFTAGDDLAKELQNHVKKVTAPYKYPRIVEFVDELPKTIGGKIKRGQIRSENIIRHG